MTREILVLCFCRPGNMTRLKITSRKRLSSQLKLATEKDRQLPREILVLCFCRSGSTTRLKSIFRKHLPLELKLVKEYLQKTLVNRTEIGDRKGEA